MEVSVTDRYDHIVKPTLADYATTLDTSTTETVSVFDGAPLVEQPLPELVEYQADPATGNWNDPETSHEEVEADEELDGDVEDESDDGEFPDDAESEDNTSSDVEPISTTSDL